MPAAVGIVATFYARNERGLLKFFPVSTDNQENVEDDPPVTKNTLRSGIELTLREGNMPHAAQHETGQWCLDKDKPVDRTGEIQLLYRPEIVARDGRYVAFANKVVCDCFSGLEWFPGPDRDTSWKEGCRWVKELSVGGGGWRLPTLKELRGLFKANKKGDHLSPLFGLTMTDVWSCEVKDESSAWGFNFLPGNQFWTCCTLSRRFRVLAVRSRMYGAFDKKTQAISA